MSENRPALCFPCDVVGVFSQHSEDLVCMCNCNVTNSINNLELCDFSPSHEFAGHHCCVVVPPVHRTAAVSYTCQSVLTHITPFTVLWLSFWATLFYNIKGTPMQLTAHTVLSCLPALASCFKKNCVLFTVLPFSGKNPGMFLPHCLWDIEKMTLCMLKLGGSKSKLKNEMALKRNLSLGTQQDWTACSPTALCEMGRGFFPFCPSLRCAFPQQKVQTAPGSSWEATGVLTHRVVAMQPHSSSGPSRATGCFAICGLLLSAYATFVGHGLLQSSPDKTINFCLYGYLKSAFISSSWRNPFQIVLEQEFQLSFSSERETELTVNR